MADGESHDLIIAGGGLAGCLVALALAKLRPEVDFLLLEQGASFGGNHIWSFFDPDIAAADRWLVEPMIAKSWDGYDVRFPRRRRTLPTRYNSLRSGLLDKRIRERLKPHRYRLQADIESVDPDGIGLAGGERILGPVLDARGPYRFEAFDLGWQKFVGREVRLAKPHGLTRPIVMDACVDQSDGYRFVYCLPFGEDRLLIEDTYYATDPALDRDAIAARIDDYARSRDWNIVEVEKEETGVLPVAMDLDFDAFWPLFANSARVGLRGAFFHPTTGYSLPDAVRMALLIAEQEDFTDLPTLLSDESARLWDERKFYRRLNRMLFRAAAPTERYRILEHFYRLPTSVIERFYAGRSTLVDKLRILTGRPPVPIGGALKALRS
jgi:lycopene beta-cyclase